MRVGFFLSIIVILIITVSGVFLCCFTNLPSLKASKWLSAIPIAHRGLFDHKNNIPENSLLAFKHAVDHGFAIELDVHLSQDHHVIVHHDAHLKRLSQKESYLKDLSAADLGAIKLLNTQETIPTLQAVFDLVKGQVPLYIEIKGGPRNAEHPYHLEEQVVSLVQAYSGPVAVLSFEAASLEYLRHYAPEILRGQNFCAEDEDLKSPLRIAVSLISALLQSKPHFLVYDNERLPSLFALVLSYFKVLISYNVNSEKEYFHVQKIAQNIIFENIKPNIKNKIEVKN